MIVGVVSDTHLPRFGRSLPPELEDGLREAGVEAILHLGDLTAPFVLELLAAIAPVEAVAGNNDPPALVARLGTRRVLELDGVRIGMTHGHLGPGLTTRDRALRAFDRAAIDVLLFGHSHAPLIETRDRLLLLNPGSPTDRRGQPDFTYALLTISGGLASGELRRFARPPTRSRPSR